MSRSSARATIETVLATNDVEDVIAAAENEPNDLSTSTEQMMASVRRAFGTDEAVELIEDVAAGPVGTDERAGRADVPTEEARDFDAEELVPDRYERLRPGDVFELVPMHGDATCAERAGQIAGVANILRRADRHPRDVEDFASEFRDLMDRMTNMLAFRDCATDQQAERFETLANEALAEWLTDPEGIKVRDRLDRLLGRLDDDVGLPED